MYIGILEIMPGILQIQPGAQSPKINPGKNGAARRDCFALPNLGTANERWKPQDP